MTAKPGTSCGFSIGALKSALIGGFICMAIVSIGSTAYGIPLTGYQESWNVPGNLAGWDPNTSVSNAAVVDVGGNGGGYVRTTGNASASFDIGIANFRPQVTGQFTGGPWTAKIDLLFTRGNFDNAWLRFRAVEGSTNGWLYPLTNNFATGQWNSWAVTFDPAWTDSQARSAGWVTDKDVSSTAISSPSWGQTMSNVMSTEVRLSGEGLLFAGIDNFSLSMVSGAPEPGTLLLVGSGLVGLVFRSKKRRKGVGPV